MPAGLSQVDAVRHQERDQKSTLRLPRLGRTGARDQLRSGRRLHLVALGIGLVLLCAIGGGEIATRSSRMGSYLGLRRAVPGGTRLRVSDLTTLSMHVGSSVSAIPLASVSTYLGRVAASDLPVGTILTPGDFLAGRSPSSGFAIVGTSLQPGQTPSTLTPGERVLAVSDSQVSTVAGTGASRAPSSLLARGSVFSIAASSQGAGGSIQVDIEVPIKAAPAVTRAAAAGALSLVEVPAEGSPNRRGASR